MGVTTTPERPDQTNPAMPGSPAGPDSWVAQAIAEQEEHIKRSSSCSGAAGQPHYWASYSLAPGSHHTQCGQCGVTRTREDYRMKISHQPASRQ